MAIAEQQQRLQRARSAVRQAEAAWGLQESWQQPWPVSADLAEVFPHGIAPGTTMSIHGSTSLLWRSAAQVAREGQWVAVIGAPRAGAVAARYAGVALNRLVFIPDPGVHTSDVVRWCLDGMTVVVVGPDASLTAREQHRLSAIARERGAVIMALEQRWPGAQVRIRARSSHTVGLGAGVGRLRAQRWTVGITDRRGSDRIVALEWSDQAYVTTASSPVASARVGR